jgi:uncharacterized protein YyaL (SSP411 family)
MERESFEDTATAALMNEHFVCIKIDREERPDLDNIYMDAVQAMGLQGGWPLNVFLMPNQKPFYGGTYFPNSKWKQLLGSIADAYAVQNMAVKPKKGTWIRTNWWKSSLSYPPSLIRNGEG